MANSKTSKKSSKPSKFAQSQALPSDRGEILSDGQNPLLSDVFRGSVNPTEDLRIRANRNRYQTANFMGGLPSQALSDLKSDPERFSRFLDYSGRRGEAKRSSVSDYMLRYNEEVDKPFNVPLGFSVPDAINRTSVRPQVSPQNQLFEDGGLLPNEYGLPEYGFGSWIKENGAGLLSGAGSAVSAIPVIGTIAGPILKGLGSIFGGIKKNRDKQKAADAEQLRLDEEAAAQQAEQDLANRQTRATNIVDDRQVNYGATFELGGDLLSGQAGGQVGGQEQPQITEYTNGEKHRESATNGIPVDARGNPATTSRQSAVGLTEKGEVTWNGYVFSDKLKT